jgi:hypothetical protein
MKRSWAGLWMLSVMGLGGACELPDARIEESPEPVSVGRLAITMAPFTGTDVVAIKVKVVPGSSDCSAMMVQQKTGTIRPDVTLAPGHPVTDTFFVLPLGTFRACLIPLSHLPGTPSSQCAPADGLAQVIAGATTEVQIFSQCKGDPRGGLDVLAALNRPPMIDALHLDPSKLALVDHDITISVDASDPDFDFPLTFTFSQVSGPSTATLTVMGSHAIFRASVAGEYEVQVVVSDDHGGHTTLTFPLHLAG